jgi:hypothetical protein
MDKRFSVLAGVILVLIGALALAFSLGMPILKVWRWSIGRLWPLAIVGIGLLFVLPPFVLGLSRLDPNGTGQTEGSRRGLGALFVPGMPILTTGAILLVANTFDWWRVWERLWPQEILALALGFLFAAIYMRVTWLLIPAIIVGLNGIVFQFCALTGLWEAWVVLWAIEPLAVGLSLLAVGARARSSRLLKAGLIVCGLAGAGLIGMTVILSAAAFLPELWLINLLGPTVVILIGLSMVVFTASEVNRRPTSAYYGPAAPGPVPKRPTSEPSQSGS